MIKLASSHQFRPKIYELSGVTTSKPPFPTFSQFISAFNNHDLRICSCEEEKNADHNQALFNKKRERGRRRGRGRGVGPWPSNFNSHCCGFIPYCQRRGNKYFQFWSLSQFIAKIDTTQVTSSQNFQNSNTQNFKKITILHLKLPQRMLTQTIFQAQIFVKTCGRPNHTA